MEKIDSSLFFFLTAHGLDFAVGHYNSIRSYQHKHTIVLDFYIVIASLGKQPQVGRTQHNIFTHKKKRLLSFYYYSGIIIISFLSFSTVLPLLLYIIPIIYIIIHTNKCIIDSKIHTHTPHTHKHIYHNIHRNIHHFPKKAKNEEIKKRRKTSIDYAGEKKA